MTGTATATSPAAEPIDTQTTPVVDPAVPATDANPADPSPVDNEGAKGPASLLDVVKSAVEKPAVPEGSPPAEGDPVVPEAKVEADPADATAEDDANLPFHNHPRWKAVIAERDSLKDPAERWGHIDGFMREHGLSGEEVAEGYEIMALLKSGDPAKLTQARDWFFDRLNALDGMLGNVLPADLQQRIDEGVLDEDGAQELARARAAATLRTAQDKARETADAQALAAQAATARTNEMEAAVNGWEGRIKASDPDYPKKAKLVLDRCRSIVVAEGKVPMTATEAVALADRALAEINAEFSSALPKPRPITPTPASTSTTVAAEPKTLRAALEASLGR